MGFGEPTVQANEKKKKKKENQPKQPQQPAPVPHHEGEEKEWRGLRLILGVFLFATLVTLPQTGALGLIVAIATSILLWKVKTIIMIFKGVKLFVIISVVCGIIYELSITVDPLAWGFLLIFGGSFLCWKKREDLKKIFSNFKSLKKKHQ